MAAEETSVYDGGEGEAGNVTPPRRPITVLVICVPPMHSYIFWEVRVRLWRRFDAQASVDLKR